MLLGLSLSVGGPLKLSAMLAECELHAPPSPRSAMFTELSFMLPEFSVCSLISVVSVMSDVSESVPWADSTESRTVRNM